MYFDILKRDLRRKKTMNVILFIFLTLAVTFITGSMNNLLAITRSTEYYFEKAQVPEFFIITISNEENDQKLHEFLSQSEQVIDFAEDDVIYIAGDEFYDVDDQKIEFRSMGCISKINLNEQKFFSKDDQIVDEVAPGCIYVPKKTMENSGIKTGDQITFRCDGYEKTFTVLGYLKDALFGSSMMGLERVVMSDADYEEIKNSTEVAMGKVTSVTPVDEAELKKQLNSQPIEIVQSGNKALIKLTYIFDMVMASVLLIVSICLILISLVILKFTITFTMSEEFREIGIMKAIGIQNRKIRMLYLIKYFALSTVSAVIGVVAGSFFGNMFIKEISKNIVLESGKETYAMSILCAIAVILLVVLFCYWVTRKVNRMSPLDAVRSGANGERFHAKSRLHLSKSRLCPSLFMALNDILCDLKRYIGLLIIFIIGTELIIVPVNTLNTLSDGNLIGWFGMVPGDLYLSNESEEMRRMVMSKEELTEKLKEVQATLKENGINADVYTNTYYKLMIAKGDNQTVHFAQTNFGLPSTEYTMTQGEAPVLINEIAVTRVTAKEIDAVIGDHVTIQIGQEKRTYLITGYFQSMNNLGEGIMFSEEEDISSLQAVSTSCIQIKYQGKVSEKQTKSYREKIEKIYPEYTVLDGSQYINKMLAGISDQFAQIKNLIIVVILIINALVAVLMMKSFLTKETGEIAMMKALGFSDRAVMVKQAARIGIVLLLAIGIGALLSGPIAQLSSGQIFIMMGASHISFVVHPIEVYVIYPVILLYVTVTASLLAAFGIRKIAIRQVNCME